jgi:hypothetical protein
MAKATCVYITPPTNTSAIALLQRAGMRLQRIDTLHYALIWRRQEVVRGLTLLEIAVWLERSGLSR